MDSVLINSKLLRKSYTLKSKSATKNIKSYLSSLTKIVPNLDAKFMSNKTAVANLDKIKLNIGPYTYPEVEKTTKILDNVSKCDGLADIEKESKNQQLVDIVDGFARSVSAILNTKYPQQYKVSNAYVKLWEIYETFDWLIPKTGTTNFFHIAEAPGQWINTTNHYFHQHMPKLVKYNWFANTLNPEHPRMKGIINALRDTYGFIKKNQKKWLYGADNSGDITNPDNIAWFNEYLHKAIPGNLDVITGDAGTNPLDVSLELLQKIDIAQAIVVACTARPGTNCVIKHFLPFMSVKPESDMATGFFMSFMYLYHILFAEFHMFKPLSSSPGSGEIYVVCRGFHGISEEQRAKLLEYMGDFTVNKPMFAKQDIPTQFASKVCKFINDLQLVNIKNKSATCKIIECFNNNSKQKLSSLDSISKSDCAFLMDKYLFKAQKTQDLEKYLDKYRIARFDKLKSRTLKNQKYKQPFKKTRHLKQRKTYHVS